MSDKKISELPDGGAVQDTDEFVAARAGGNVKIAGSAIGTGGSNSLIAPVTVTSDDSTEGEAGLDVLARPLQDTGDDVSNVFQVSASNGDELVGIDYTGTIDATAGIRVGILGVADAPRCQIGQDGSIQIGTDSTALVIKNALQTRTSFKVDQASSFGTVQASAAQNGVTALFITGADSGGGDAIQYQGPPDFDPLFRVLADGGIVANFPTSDPHVAGQLWNSSGVIHVSAG